VNPGGEWGITVEFTPTATGSHNGTLVITHNADNENDPLEIPLRGIAN
jgi:hypothetical protein